MKTRTRQAVAIAEPTPAPALEIDEIEEDQVRRRAPGGGRPKLPKNKRRGSPTYVSLSEREKDKLDREAKRLGLTLSFYLRKRIGLDTEGALKRRDTEALPAAE